MLTIYTHSPSPFTKEFLKQAVKKIVGKYSGPDAVCDSLLRGLTKDGIAYNLNPNSPKNDTVIVLSGVAALKSAIRQKERGAIKKLIAGPNIVSTPHDAEGIMRNPAIDTILIPSKWVADFWEQEAPELKNKIRIWAAGVRVAAPGTRNGNPIVYDKMEDSALLAHIVTTIIESGATPHIFTYASYNHANYMKALATAPYLIYLSKSESQGLALQEAWAHDVPTLVHKSTVWESGSHRFEAEQINAPYLTDQLGAIFSTNEELKDLIVHTKTYHPKVYCDQKHSDKVSAATLLQIL